MYYPSLNKLQKTFIKVLNMSRFAIVRKSILLSKRCIHKKTYEVDQELGGGELSLPAFPEVRNRAPKNKNMQNCLRLKLLTLGVGDYLLLPLTSIPLSKGRVAIFQR